MGTIRELESNVCIIALEQSADEHLKREVVCEGTTWARSIICQPMDPKVYKLNVNM